jgi:nicotinamidase/pyrazinamidase
VNASGSTALIVVDLQNDFADPAGSLAVAGGSDIVPIVNAMVRVATAAGTFEIGRASCRERVSRSV